MKGWYLFSLILRWRRSITWRPGEDSRALNEVPAQGPILASRESRAAFGEGEATMSAVWQRIYRAACS